MCEDAGLTFFYVCAQTWLLLCEMKTPRARGSLVPTAGHCRASCSLIFFFFTCLKTRASFIKSRPHHSQALLFRPQFLPVPAAGTQGDCNSILWYCVDPFILPRKCLLLTPLPTFWHLYMPSTVLMVQVRIAPIGTYIWILGDQLVELFRED